MQYYSWQGMHSIKKTFHCIPTMHSHGRVYCVYTVAQKNRAVGALSEKNVLKISQGSECGNYAQCTLLKIYNVFKYTVHVIFRCFRLFRETFSDSS